MRDAWVNVMDIEPKLEDITLSAQFARVALPTESVLTIVFEIRVNDVTANVPGQYVQRVWGTAWAPPADLVSGRTYTWQVRALNASGVGVMTAASVISTRSA